MLWLNLFKIYGILHIQYESYIIFRCAQSIALLMKSTKNKKKKYLDESNISVFVIELLLIANVTLLLIDHVHFQYNGFLFGILLISISHILKVKNITFKL